jgi:hypothetical protein
MDGMPFVATITEMFKSCSKLWVLFFQISEKDVIVSTSRGRREGAVNNRNTGKLMDAGAAAPPISSSIR